jgi:argininosuccinate synthase
MEFRKKSFQTIETIKYAKAGCKRDCHGSTGAGNDLIFPNYCSKIKIILSIRENYRQEESRLFIKKNGVHYSWEKAQYSINKALGN